MIKTEVKLKYGYTSEDIVSAICARLPILESEIRELRIIKRSLNISDKDNIHYDTVIGVSLSNDRESGLLKMRKKVSAVEDMSLSLPLCKFKSRPVVVGAGPAGLFCALLLAEAGACPILLERGLSVDQRVKKVDNFVKLGVLDPECNVQFGEGGAGSFSDGKLKSGSIDKYKYKILSEFVNAGAPEDILYSVGAHVGTDKLREVVKNIRERIVSLGGEVYFSTRLTSIIVKDGRVIGCKAISENNEITFDTDALALATGHSARDVFVMLNSMGVPMEAKGFGIGLRIEHPREYIDELVYGKNRPSDIGAASYHLVTHLPNGRSAYSFCMCPGGTVVAAASEQGGIVTNGMSEYARNAYNSNAAFLVSVTPADFGSDGPLAGIELQRSIEQKAFILAGSSYKAPATTLGAFMEGKSNGFTAVKPSYAVGVEEISPESYLPSYVTDTLRLAIPDFDNWMAGFYLPEAIMTGPETRTTSPVRVLRGVSCEAIGFGGLYPTGEGAGYAGGIVSSARDGLLIAEKIIEKNKV